VKIIMHLYLLNISEPISAIIVIFNYESDIDGNL
jgi:hypothetical protein